mmetsp:Transcript_834/g.3462  ORF Transcript_834/g.3462 Transcript_834/m.3462 type:complete len:311 (-) Transcript_834:2583-3515(-)
MVVTRGTFSPTAVRRISRPSFISASSPEEVTIMREISLLRSMSPMCGRPSWIFGATVTGTPASSITFAVPPVATTVMPISANCLATSVATALSLSRTEMKTLPLVGNRCPAASCALAYALVKSLSMPMTSPVERISGPRSVSAPGNLSKGRTASFTATWSSFTSSVKLMSFSVAPAITSDAYLARGWPIALATKGTVRDARGLASMMYTVPSGITAYWMLMRPTTPRRFATLGVHSRMVARDDSLMVCEGMLHAESPECTPACSMCSMMPAITTLPSASQSASTSSSVALFRYLSTSTGFSGSTSTAVVM